MWREPDRERESVPGDCFWCSDCWYRIDPDDEQLCVGYGWMKYGHTRATDTVHFVENRLHFGDNGWSITGRECIRCGWKQIEGTL